MIPESGNLLVMARLNFRVKCNNHFRDSAPLGRCLLFYESRHFFMECACSYELYMIKWQAILLRIHSFPPRTHERIIFLPRGGIATSFFYGKNHECIILEGGNKRGETILGRKNFHITVIRNVNISHAIQEQIRIISTVCSVIVLCMHWEINVEAISDSWTAGSRIVPDAKFRIKERITDTSQANIRNLLNL